MSYLYFIGITLSNELSNNQDELNGSDITVNGKNVYYKDRCLRTNISDVSNLTSEDIGKIQLTSYELQHFINELKRVRSNEIYNLYNDNLSLHKICVSKTKIIPIRKNKEVRDLGD